MCKVTLDNININNINIDFFDLNLCVRYDMFVSNDKITKVIYHGYLGKNEIMCFFAFTLTMIIDKNVDDISMLKITYSYLIDILISVIIIILDIV